MTLAIIIRTIAILIALFILSVSIYLNLSHKKVSDKAAIALFVVMVIICVVGGIATWAIRLSILTQLF